MNNISKISHPVIYKPVTDRNIIKNERKRRKEEMEKIDKSHSASSRDRGGTSVA